MNNRQIAPSLVVVVTLLVTLGCSSQRDCPGGVCENNAATQDLRLTDQWYCYGRPDVTWDCHNEPRDDLITSIGSANTYDAPSLELGEDEQPSGPDIGLGAALVAGLQLAEAEEAAAVDAATVEAAAVGAATVEAAAVEAAAADTGTSPEEKATMTATAAEPDVAIQTATVAADRGQQLMDVPSDYFVVQLAAMPKRQDISRYAIEQGIEDAQVIAIESGGEPLYLLLLGTYPTRQQAERARDAWESGRGLKVKPWIRRAGPLQEASQSSGDGE